MIQNTQNTSGALGFPYTGSRSRSIILLIASVVGTGALIFGAIALASPNGLPNWFSNAIQIIGPKGIKTILIAGCVINTGVIITIIIFRTRYNRQQIATFPHLQQY